MCFFPFAKKGLASGFLNTVLYLLAIIVLGITLIEHVICPILIYNVVVNASILGRKEHLWFTLKTGEVGICVCIISDKALSVATLEGEVYHVLVHLVVINGLRCPYPVGITEILGIVL